MVSAVLSEFIERLRNGVPKEVDFRLDQWARWTRQRAFDCGWPAETLLARVIEYGPMGASQGGPPPVVIPASVEEVDKILARMPAELKGVLLLHYLAYAPIEANARKCGMSKSTFRSKLEAGQWYVHARLS